jgi:hypothetical protein
LKTFSFVILLSALFSVLSCSKPQQGSDAQQISLPSNADIERLSRHRAVVERYLNEEESRVSYQTPAGKLRVLRRLLAQNVFHRTQTSELQSLGIVLGDAFVQQLGMEWVVVRDEHGKDLALRLPGTSTIVYPATMISKRIERGETVDVFDLFNGVARKVNELQRQSQ